MLVYVDKQRPGHALVEDLNAPEVLGVAVAVGGLALGDGLEGLEVLLVQNNILEVGDDAGLGGRLGDDAGAALDSPGDQDIGVVAVVLLGNLGDLLTLDQGGVGRSEGGVSSEVDALGLAELEQLPLGVLGVELDLVGGGDNLGGGEELLEVLDREVGDTDGLGLAGGDQGLHGLVGLGKVNVLEQELALAVAGHGVGARLEGDGPVLIVENQKSLIGTCENKVKREKS